MQDVLDLLTEAIGDVGFWRWWAADLPRVVQLEFGAVQFATATPEGPRPVGPVALRFREPRSAVFLTRDAAAVPDHWPDLLHEDRCEPFALSYEQLVFTDGPSAANVFAAEAVAAGTLIGARPTLAEWREAPARMAFWAGPVGMAILAERMEVIVDSGPIDSPSAMAAMHDAWWEYWQEYWARRGSPNALPWDGACEVTIPLAEAADTPPAAP